MFGDRSIGHHSLMKQNERKIQLRGRCEIGGKKKRADGP